MREKLPELRPRLEQLRFRSARRNAELFSDLDAPVVRVAADDCHLPYNGAEEAAILPDASDVVAAARRLLAY